MKKGSIFHSLPFKLLVGVIAGVVFGLLFSATDSNRFTGAALNIVVTLKYVINQIINFIIPLIIIAFIAPSITQLGKNASKLLLIAVSIAYASSVGAAFFSTAAGYVLIPHLSISPTVDGLKSIPDAVFELSIPQIMPVMSALVFSVMIGLAAAWTKAELISNILIEFQKIVLAIVTRIMIPILPLFIGLTFCTLSYEGSITKQAPVFLKIIIIVLLGHYIWMALLYTIAGIYSKKNPLDVIKCYGPAYLTAIGTMSSAATLAVALQCAGKAKPLRKDMVSFGIPLFSNIHLCLLGAHLLADAGRRGRAVVAVRDVGARDVGQHHLEGLDGGWAGHAPDGLADALAVREVIEGLRALCGFHQRLQRRIVAVGEEDWARLAARRADVADAVLLLGAAGALVAADDAVVVVVE